MMIEAEKQYGGNYMTLIILFLIIDPEYCTSTLDGFMSPLQKRLVVTRMQNK
jgi:hypothetical protein